MVLVGTAKGLFSCGRGIVVGFMPDSPEPEFGQCVHKVARDAADPERLYLQHHGGIYRSDDGGGSWAAMRGIAGMDFGFLDGLATPISAGQSLSIIPAISGG